MAFTKVTLPLPTEVCEVVYERLFSSLEPTLTLGIVSPIYPRDNSALALLGVSRRTRQQSAYHLLRHLRLSVDSRSLHYYLSKPRSVPLPIWDVRQLTIRMGAAKSFSCPATVFRKFPNLKKLTINLELSTLATTLCQSDRPADRGLFHHMLVIAIKQLKRTYTNTSDLVPAFAAMAEAKKVELELVFSGANLPTITTDVVLEKVRLSDGKGVHDQDLSGANDGWWDRHFERCVGALAQAKAQAEENLESMVNLRATPEYAPLALFGDDVAVGGEKPSMTLSLRPATNSSRWIRVGEDRNGPPHWW
ncbi:uncharacterized protein HMPREF1541_09522 [Cyphellophora europaea CBS 101466]|uniref:Uncharacterized protein n=1 Tax=Cyphellophora europaea (strain CBS 101466) TaxID=1220924 RepID=W2SCM9_CYPE1|nr:uncharacterized protein HMPREF1541_09522 [Cyphellophora europaea CBS 101466]ETN45689.1 hypothetical protein HMPREF1541_09522 [Cyphellophora europaea CBS 101466]